MMNPLFSNVCQLFIFTPLTLSLAGNQRAQSMYPGLSNSKYVRIAAAVDVWCFCLRPPSHSELPPEFSFLDVVPVGALELPSPHFLSIGMLSTPTPLQVHSSHLPFHLPLPHRNIYHGYKINAQSNVCMSDGL